MDYERVSVHFGALCPPLKEQVGDLPEIDALQKDADAITRLCLRGLLTEKESKSARSRLLKKIASLVYEDGKRRK